MLDKLIDTKEYFNKIRLEQNVVCYGAGSKGIQSLHLLREMDIEPQYFIDSNKSKWGTKVEGIEVIGYEKLKELTSQYCILLTCVYTNACEIELFLREQGEKNPIIFFANPFKAEEKLLSIEEVKNNKLNLEKSYKYLSDEKSKNIMLDFLNWKMTGNQSYTYRYTEGDWKEFFYDDILPKSKKYTYVDIGAYTGDSIIRFLAFAEGFYDKIIAFEPDKSNFNAMRDSFDKLRLNNLKIEYINKGLWSCNTELSFYSAPDNKIYESSNFFADTDRLIMSGRKIDGMQHEEKVNVNTLDSYKINADKLLIKIDALASEAEILFGGGQIIKEQHPILIFEFGTHSKHIFDLIPFIYHLDNSYKFYLRQLSTFNNSRTILYVL